MERLYSKKDLADPEKRKKIITEFAEKKWIMTVQSIQKKGYTLEHTSFSGAVFAEFTKISTKDKLRKGDQVEVEVDLIEKRGWKFRVKNGKSVNPSQEKQFQIEESEQLLAVSKDDKIKVKSLLNELSKFVSWNLDDEVEGVRKKLKEFKWLNASKIEKAEKHGKDIKNELNSFKRLLIKNDPNSTTVLKCKKKLSHRFPEITTKLNKMIDYRKNQNERLKDVRKRIKKGQTLSVIRSDLDHRIQNLIPSALWTLLIDETGDSFDSRHSGRGLRGRFVGILLPDSVSLSELSSFHATESSLDEIDKTLQALLDQPVGVFGIAVDDLPETEGERWVDGVMETIHWVWRLLPIDKSMNKSSLNILIEQRGTYEAGQDWNAVRRELMRGWAALDSERAKQIGISLELIEKDDHSYNGYVDAVAFTWGSSNVASVDRLKKSGLLGTCLHEGNGPTLRTLWDAMAREDNIAGSDWRWLISLLESEDERSIAGSLLKRIGESSKLNIKKWEIFFKEVRDHLESKAVNLIGLGRECEWLEKYKPADAIVPNTLKLGWLTSKLALANHMGETHRKDIEREIEDMSAKVLDEDARLVCLADLHRAVLATNRFDFAAAEQSLIRWKDMPTMIPGLQMTARVESSFGQHLAFQGFYSEARDKFNKAVELFNRMSDEQAAIGEKEQTLNYLAIATMDDINIPHGMKKDAVEKVTGPVKKAIAELSSDNQDRLKYTQHLLVRYLAHCGTEEEKNEYLKYKDKWTFSKGHPWQLIEFYRGLLVHPLEPDLAARHFENAWELATIAGQGPTVRYIGLCLGVTAVAFMMVNEWPVDSEGMRKLIREIPMAADRFEILHRALTQRNQPPESEPKEQMGSEILERPKWKSFLNRLNTPETHESYSNGEIDEPIELSSPLELLARILPFNFR